MSRGIISQSCCLLSLVISVSASAALGAPAKPQENKAPSASKRSTVDRQLTAAQVEFFEKKIRPVLAEHCYECHSSRADDLQADLKLDYRSSLRAGGESGPAIVAGDPSASLLIQALKHEGLEMPPEYKLPDAVIADFENWIQQGAPDPRDEAALEEAVSQTLSGLDHWAFQPVLDATLPEIHDAQWPLADVDHFVLARLSENGLRPNGDADRYVWLRRVSLDLTGLPPTIDEINDFVADDSDFAYERVVDRLLGSQAFGERWSRHWLDLVGYADQKGTQAPIYAANAWRYRDYVINSFNDDVPFDHFIRQQVAGDLMDYESLEEHRENLIATGFLVLGDLPLVEADKQKLRIDVADLQVDKVGKAVLGMTLGCARCHDHKFDPIPRDDYYAMAGMFFSTASVHKTTVGTWSDVNDIELPESPSERLTRLKEENEQGRLLVSLTDELEQARRRVSELDELLKEVDAQEKAEQEAEEKKKAAAEANAAETEQDDADADEAKQLEASEESEEKNEEQAATEEAAEEKADKFEKDRKAVSDRKAEDGDSGQGDEAETDGDEPADPHEKLKKERTELRARIPKLEHQIAHAELFVSQMPLAHAVADIDEPADMQITIRGNPRALGAAVPRGVLSAVSRQPIEIPANQSGRLQLADWLVSQDNPLTARVFVNRIWQRLIGAGLQRNVDYFGLPEEAPSHPQLLDYLAASFVKNGWSRKQLIRSIVLSRTYRLSSDHNARGHAYDPDNRLVWRMNRSRMDAEALRDSLIAAGGEIQHLAGGPTLPYEIPENVVNIGKGRIFINLVFFNLAKFRPGQEFLRTAYLPVVRGTGQHKLAELRNVFDFTPPALTRGKRNVTTVPSQSLFLMNSPRIKEHAERIAERLVAETQDELHRLELLWLYVLNRPVTEQELKSATAFLDESEDDAWPELCHALIASNEFLMRL